MIYSEFKGLKLSKLGFGTMRLPQLQDGKTIDKDLTARMFDMAIKAGVNYFDTAAPYHGGWSEVVTGDILKSYPRDSFFLADKYPGHQHSASFDPQATFESQLRKCGVEYFDFYLLHNVCENSWDNYMDPRWGMLDYFVSQVECGRIRHLGFSCHADIPALEAFLDSPYGEHMEFCQIQLNYLDWTLQNAGEKCRILNERNIPIWVMEPVRGGKLAGLDDESTAALRACRPDESTAAWAFRWLQGLPGVTMILSGMSDTAQVEDNLKSFSQEKPLSEDEAALLLSLAERLKDNVPCTGCRYCCDACPQGLDIPLLIKCYNDLKVQFNFTPLMRIEALPEELRPSSCLQCGACAQMCPQGIAIPDIISELSGILDKHPSWADICRQRAAEAASFGK